MVGRRVQEALKPFSPFSQTVHLFQPLSSYSSYGTPEPEPEPEPLPRFTRRLSPSRPSTSSHYRQLSSTSSSSSNRRLTSFTSSSRLPTRTSATTSSQRKTSSRAKWNLVGARERSSAVKVKDTKSPVKKAKTPVIGTKSRVKAAKTETTKAPSVKTSGVREPTR